MFAIFGILVALAVTGCKKNPPAAAPTPSPSPSVTASVEPSPTAPTSAPTSTAPTTPGQTTKPPTAGFPSNAEQYTREFVEAWIKGNTDRMRALSSPAIVSFATSNAPPSKTYTVTLSPAEVWVFEVTSSGGNYRFVLQGELGKAGAITKLMPM